MPLKRSERTHAVLDHLRAARVKTDERNTATIFRGEVASALGLSNRQVYREIQRLTVARVIDCHYRMSDGTDVIHFAEDNP